MVRKIFLLIFCALSFACLSAQGQDVNVRGRVVDETGNPAVGAAVMLVGADNIGVITDVEGKFTITAPSGGGTSDFLFGLQDSGSQCGGKG